MKQIVFTGKKSFELRQMDTVSPNQNQAMLRTIISGISAGTEKMWWDGTATALKSGRKNYPYFPGYELVGEVVKIGENFSGLSVGDRVFAMKPHADFSLIGPNDVWFRLPRELSAEAAVAIALTGTSLHAIHRSGVTIGDRCAVVGLGVLGFNLIQTLSHAVSCSVIAITNGTEKQDLARKMGAEVALTSADAMSEPAVAFSFDSSGVNSGLDVAVKMTADQGVVTAAGFYTEPMQIDSEAVFSRELTIRGVRATGVAQSGNPFNRWDRKSTMELAARLVMTGAVQNQMLVTHNCSVDEAPDVYEMITERTEPYLQVLFDWSK